MKLQPLIELTRTPCNDLDGGAMQVFPNVENWHLFFELVDYVVSGHVSGPGLILCPR